MRSAREKLEVVPGLSEEERATPASFLGVQKFDTDVHSCLQDANKALSYQTGTGRNRNICLKLRYFRLKLELLFFIDRIYLMINPCTGDYFQPQTFSNYVVVYVI